MGTHLFDARPGYREAASYASNRRHNFLWTRVQIVSDVSKTLYLLTGRTTSTVNEHINIRCTANNPFPDEQAPVGILRTGEANTMAVDLRACSQGH